MLMVATRRPSWSLAWATWTSRWVSIPTVIWGAPGCAMLVMDGVLAARAEYGIDLVGPLPPDSGWQARDEHGFDLTQFHIDWDQQQVTCPTGKTSRNWRTSTSRHGLPIIQATFRGPGLHPLP
jgi:hypothetical protein